MAKERKKMATKNVVVANSLRFNVSPIFVLLCVRSLYLSFRVAISAICLPLLLVRREKKTIYYCLCTERHLIIIIFAYEI